MANNEVNDDNFVVDDEESKPKKRGRSKKTFVGGEKKLHSEGKAGTIKNPPRPVKPLMMSKEEFARELERLRKLPEVKVEEMSAEEVREEIEKTKEEISMLEKQLSGEGTASEERATLELEDYEVEDFVMPEHCVPIRCDVRVFDFDKLAEHVDDFDVVVMDPPWKLAGAAPTRGVALGYAQLQDDAIASIPIPKIQKNGFLFIWVINSRYSLALKLFEKWGYEMVDDISWVKATINRRLAKGHGFYLQHAKETCLVGKKGMDPPSLQRNVGSDVIFSQRRGQSQKPTELYELIEKLVPNGKYLEIFGRRNNLRNHWCTIGLEL